MSKAKIEELGPNEIVRKGDGPKYFGLKPTALDKAIKEKRVPAPFVLTDGGYARGWLGRQIIEWQAQRIVAAKRSQAA